MKFNTAEARDPKLTLGPIWQGYQFATFASPGYRRSWRSRRGALEGYVGALTYYHIGAGRIVQNVGGNCGCNM